VNLTEARHKLHTLAELSGQEFKTREFIINRLKEFSPDKIHTFDHCNCIVAEYVFSDDSHTTLLRADFDAVPVKETLPLPYSSCTEGVAHKCGHDGHTTILLGVAERLSLWKAENGKQIGRVLLLFQAAEETGEGMESFIGTHFLDSYDIRRVFALHNIPGYPSASVICKTGSFTCSVISCDIHFTGQSAHAAEPQTGVSPVLPMLEMAKTVSSWNQIDMTLPDYRIITIIEASAGHADYGVAASEGVLRLTIRTKEDKALKSLMADIEALADKIAKEGRLEHSISWLQYFAENKNEASSVEMIRGAAAKNDLKYIEKEQPFAWGEDFGLLTQRYNGAMYGVGSGEAHPGLHHADYDFPDEILEPAVKMFISLLK